MRDGAQEEEGSRQVLKPLAYALLATVACLLLQLDAAFSVAVVAGVAVLGVVR